jgi:hypothetical protein
MHTDREESGEEIEMQENIQELLFSVHHSFLKYSKTKCAKILHICIGNQNNESIDLQQ